MSGRVMHQNPDRGACGRIADYLTTRRVVRLIRKREWKKASDMGQRAIAGCSACLNDKKPEVRGCAALVLGEIANGNPGVDCSLDSLINAALCDASPAVRAGAIWAVQKHGEAAIRQLAATFLRIIENGGRAIELIGARDEIAKVPNSNLLRKLLEKLMAGQK